MTRPTRQILPGHPNHVVVRGNNRRRLFSYKNEFRMFVNLMTRAFRERGCGLTASNLLTNHAHMLMIPPTVSDASMCVKQFSQRYAQIRNARREATGKLFEQRFYSKPIMSDLQLAYTVMYIDANAMRAGLVEDPIDYPWSTYPIHAGEPERSAIPISCWVPSSWYRGLGRTTDERAERYRQVFAMYAALDVKPDHADEVRRYEQLSEDPYRHRLRRPNQSSAAEPVERFVIRAEKRKKNG